MPCLSLYKTINAYFIFKSTVLTRFLQEKQTTVRHQAQCIKHIHAWVMMMVCTCSENEIISAATCYKQVVSTYLVH